MHGICHRTVCHVRLLSEGFCLLDVLVPQQCQCDSAFRKLVVNVEVVGFKVYADSGIPFRKVDGFDLFVGYRFFQRSGQVGHFCSSKHIPHGKVGTMYT